MILLLENDTLTEDSIKRALTEKDKPHLCEFGFSEFEKVSHKLGISEKTTKDIFSSEISIFESHDGYDFIVLNIPDIVNMKKEPQRVCVYFSRNLLMFISNDDPVITNIVDSIRTEPLKNLSLSKIIHLYFDKLTYDDSLDLRNMEQEIADLEDELMLLKKIDLLDLMTFRKKLLSLKLYYQQLLEVYEGIEQNENALIDLKEERNFRILSGRANRLYNGVMNLRDYVTQVREAYQTQIDINLNSIMKVFTVITSFFFPLTLIVGWYGMNLKMPEFGWRYGYLFVIGISVMTAIGTLFFFKRKKWL